MGPQSAAKRITHTNFEFKARLKDDLRVRAALKKLRTRFVGTDHQIDTYFRVTNGRLKLREGRIENALIFYHRTNRQHARESKVQIAELPSGSGVRRLLEAALGVLAVVEKRREIYLVGNVKIHLDRVPGLGEFVEVEAIKKSKPAGQSRKFAEAQSAGRRAIFKGSSESRTRKSSLCPTQTWFQRNRPVVLRTDGASVAALPPARIRPSGVCPAEQLER